MKHALVSHWMTKEVIVGDQHMRLHDALRLVNKMNIRALPVVNNDELVGIVTKRDLLRADTSSILKEWTDQYRLIGNLPLEKIMSVAVITTQSNAHIAAAARLLLDNKITALPVVDDNKHMSGILTSSDVFRMIIDEVPLLPAKIKVGDYMSRDLITIDPNANLLEAQRSMAVKRVRALPVVQDGLLLGIVTLSDLLSASPSMAVSQGRQEVNMMVMDTPICFIMTSSPMTVQEDANIIEAARLMLENKIHCLPVMNSQQDLVGIITESDLFRMIILRFL